MDEKATRARLTGLSYLLAFGVVVVVGLAATAQRPAAEKDGGEALRATVERALRMTREAGDAAPRHRASLLREAKLLLQGVESDAALPALDRVHVQELLRKLDRMSLIVE